MTARLEVNEWGGAVEPRLVVRSVHAVQEVDPCAFDQPRPGAESWWRQLLAELDAPLGGSSAVTPPGVPRTVVDRRGQGALGLLAGLMTTGEALLVVCADVSRRRGLFGRELAPERFERPPLSLLDHASFASAPEVAQRFTHIFVLDPPSTAAGRGSLELSGTARRESFLHLAWGPAEVDFAARILEHELVLRPSLASLYRALSASGAETSGKALAGVLAGPGPHPRNAIHAARCLRVLVELGLVAIERSSATVRCTITSAERVSLERSSAYTAYARRYEEELRFLSEQTGQTKTSPMTQAA